MTDNTSNQQQPSLALVPDKRQSKQQAAQAVQPTQAQALPAAEPAKRLDETVPGGRYFVNNQWVNANGEPLDEQEERD